MALLSRDGLCGVTIGVLSERVGMSKSGVFAHFKSKEEVQLALLDYVARFAQTVVDEPVMRAAEGLERLQTAVKLWFGWSERAGLPGGCPFAAGMFELDDAEGPVREKLMEMDAAWRGFLKQNVHQAVVLGQLRSELDEDQFVWELCGIYLSHHVARRFSRVPDADERAERAFQGLVERSLPVGGER